MLNLSQQALYVLDAKENLRISTLNHENITSFFSEVPETYPEHLTIFHKMFIVPYDDNIKPQERYTN